MIRSSGSRLPKGVEMWYTKKRIIIVIVIIIVVTAAIAIIKQLI